MTRLITIAAFLPPLLLARPALAQDIVHPVERWSIDAGIGVLVRPTGGIDADQRTTARNRETALNGDSSAAISMGLARYWTTHLRSDVGVSWHGQVSGYDTELVPFPALPGGATVFTDKTIDFATAHATAAYQFREDAFTHPYLAGGLRLAWRREHRFRDARTYTDYLGPFPARPIRYTVDALDEKVNQLLVRPYVAVGAKLYFNWRLYLRPEASATIAGDRRWDATLRVAFGTDF